MSILFPCAFTLVLHLICRFLTLTYTVSYTIYFNALVTTIVIKSIAYYKKFKFKGNRSMKNDEPSGSGAINLYKNNFCHITDVLSAFTAYCIKIIQQEEIVKI